MTQVKLPVRPSWSSPAITGTRWGAATPRACTARCSTRWSRRSRSNPRHREHRVGEPRARQRDDRDGDQPALRLAFGRRARRDRADRAGPLGAGRPTGSSASALRPASGAISSSTPCSTSSTASEWNREADPPCVEEDPRRATAMAEGALIRLKCGERCFEAYRERLWG